MTVRDIKEALKGVSPIAEIVFFTEGTAEDDDGNKLMPGIGYFDIESGEFVYIGDIAVMDDDDI